MFKNGLYLILFLSISFNALAQRELILYGAEPNIYIKHKVMPKENLYSIGRMYNVSPSLHIAPTNKIKLTAILKDDQYLKIPLIPTNFSQADGVNDTMTKFEVKYYVQPKDNLGLVGTKMNKLDVNTIKKWNNLNSEILQIGQLLKVGYLLVPNVNAWALKNEPNPNPILETKPVINVLNESSKPDIKPVTLLTKEDKKLDVTPITPTIKEDKPLPKKEIEVDYFKPQFKGLGNVNKVMNLGFFNSNANKKDKKYYALINLISPGTIIKVTNPINGKTIFAQVLNGLENVIYNKGLQLRLSNNTTSVLGVVEEDKIVKLEVSY